VKEGEKVLGNEAGMGQCSGCWHCHSTSMRQRRKLVRRRGADANAAKGLRCRSQSACRPL